ncbi:response regulator [bacterium]|nr:response regulator [bacterium]
MTQGNILLVDDEERFLQTTCKLLKKKGYSVSTADCGTDALDKLSRTQIEVVVLDVKMPGMDGLQVLKIIKQEYPLVEVIMLTGHATVESALEGLESGASDYIMKPADLNELTAKIDDALEKYQLIKEKIALAQAKHLQEL